MRFFRCGICVTIIVPISKGLFLWSSRLGDGSKFQVHKITNMCNNTILSVILALIADY